MHIYTQFTQLIWIKIFNILHENPINNHKVQEASTQVKRPKSSHAEKWIKNRKRVIWMKPYILFILEYNVPFPMT